MTIMKTKKQSFFSNKLVELRKIHQMTQDDLAKALGVSRSLVNYYENRSKNPTVEALEKVAKVFGIQPQELLSPAENQAKVGSPSRLDRLIIKLQTLSAHKQRMIANMLEAAINSQ